MIPQDPEGYAVNAPLRLVHRRYASHAEGLPRTRTLAGVATLVGDTEEPVVCRQCWPNYRKPRPRKVKP